MEHQSIVAMLAGWSETRGETLCAADPKGSATYHQVMQAVYFLHRKLLELGVEPGDPVVAECTQNRQFLILELALELTHAVFVPVERGAADSRVLQILGETGATLYFTRKEYTEQPGWHSTKELAEWIEACWSEERTAEFASADLTALDWPRAEEVAQILYSTGTTGKSKGIVLTHANNIACAENICYGVEMKSENVELIPMPLSHAHGIRTAYASILNGSGMVLTNGVTFMKVIFDLLDRYHVTGFDMSPSILRLIFQLSGDRLSTYNGQLDYVEIGSAMLPQEDKDRLKQLLPDVRLYDFYGSSESGRTCVLNFNSADDKPKCIGKPARNATFLFTDDDRREIEATEAHPGLLASKGSMNMKGYYHNPALTAEVMDDEGYIYTNDLGYRGADGLIYCLGREDDVINCSGVKISPEEIEEVVIHYPGVRDCCCIPVADPMKGQAPKIFLQLEEDAAEPFDQKAFLRFCRAELDQTKQPAAVEVIDAIPRTYNGKAQRKKLIAREQDRDKR